MNILFFLTPKSDVAYIYDDENLRQVLEKMEYHKYAAVPILSRQGRYVGTMTEGDLLWYIKNHMDLNLLDAKKVHISDIPRRLDNRPVRVGCRMEDLLETAMQQNFVPVLDDNQSFIGIVTRKDIIKYFCADRGEAVKEAAASAEDEVARAV